MHRQNYKKPFITATDASKRAKGAILSQKDDKAGENLTHYASRCLNDAEKN